MTYKQRITREQLLSCNPDINEWPQNDKSALTGKTLSSYEQRENIIYEYFSGTLIKHIAETYNVSRRQIHKLVNKCIKTHKDGKIWGFRALIPYKRQKNYTRIKQQSGSNRIEQRSGMSGLLHQLFERYPDMQEEIDEYFLKKNKRIIVHESRITFKSAFKRFIDACRIRGIKNEYPFTAKYMGYRSLIEYLKKLAFSYYEEVIKARFSKDASNKLKLGGTEQQMMPVTKPFQRVEFDGHNIDIVFVLEVPSPHGGTTAVPVDRLWILTIRESLTGAIIGYHFFDVMQCIKKTIMPWIPRNLSIPALKYPENGGIPSAIIEKARWAIFQEICFDNAKANLSDEVTRVLIDVVGCAVNAGPIHFPERRAMIERFYGIFEENGFHRLPSTLGSNQKDPRRKNPEMLAQKYNIKLEDIKDLVELLIADFNGTPTIRNGYRSPIEQLRFLLKDENVFIPKLDERKRTKLCMFDLRYERKIRGSVKDGIRPYVTVEGAKYTNNILSNTPALIGKKLIIYIDPNDPRYGESFFGDDGAEFGMLQATGHWGSKHHTLDMRRAINKSRDKQLKYYTDNQDAIHAYLDNTQKEALASKKGRKKLIKIEEAQKTAKTKSFIDNNNGNIQDQEKTGQGEQRKIDPAMWDQKGYLD